MTDIDLSDLAADRDGSRPLRGYLASPAGTGPWPAVVMIHEIFGLDDVMRGHADRLYTAVADAGRGPDVVFANAAAIDVARIGEVTQEHLQKALPLLNDGGSIILNSSNTKAKDNDGVYQAVMAALRSLARTWASELRDRKIRVNVISPDATQTPGLDSLDGTLSIVPLARYATADEVANAALFLAADLTDETLRGAGITVRSAEKISATHRTPHIFPNERAGS